MIGQFQAALDHLTVMINAEDGEGLYRQFASAKAYREGFGNGNDGDDRKRTA